MTNRKIPYLTVALVIINAVVFFIMNSDKILLVFEKIYTFAVCKYYQKSPVCPTRTASI